VKQLERGYIDRGQRLKKSEKARAEAVDEVKEKDVEIARLEGQGKFELREQAEKLGHKLDEKEKARQGAVEQKKRLEKALAEKDKKLENAGDPDALRKAQEELAAAGKTDREQKETIEKVQKENDLLRQAVENYKQADAERDRGREME